MRSKGLAGLTWCDLNIARFKFWAMKGGGGDAIMTKYFFSSPPRHHLFLAQIYKRGNGRNLFFITMTRTFCAFATVAIR